MRTFVIVLGCFAWILSCFTAVSYYRASEGQQAISIRLQSAEAQAANAQASAGQDSARLRQRLKQDEAVVAGDEQALDKTHKQGADDLSDKQTLAADQAALQADRMMQYTVENFSRMEPDQQVVAAANKVDLDQRLLADALATEARDRRLSHGLLALWFVVAGAAFLAFRGARLPELAAEEEEDDEHEVGDDLVSAEDTDG